MRKLFLLLFIILIFVSGCMNNRKEEKTKEAVVDTVQKSKTATVETDDCVFDTSTYKFTKEALQKYRKGIKFSWNNQEKEATTVFENGDTLLLHIGGCYHFNYSASLKSSIPFDNDKALTDKSKWLAKTFFSDGFDTKYDALISSGQFRKNENYYPKSAKAFEIIEKDTTVTDKVFEGFTFEKSGKGTRITISGYVN